MARLEISRSTRNRLFALSGNQCAFPGCTQKIYESGSDNNISQICHIEAAEKGGERYNENSDDEERRSFENLILLCPTHHAITDDVTIYTVEVMRKMKQDHEDKVLVAFAEDNLLANYPSALNSIIASLGSVIFDSKTNNEPINAPDTEKKILYNNVTRYRPIIEEYKVFQGKLNKIYEEIEYQGSPLKQQVLLNIKTAYLEEKGKYNGIEEIRLNADSIIEDVENKLWKIIENTSNKNIRIPIEVIKISLNIVMVDAFMRCSILEEPPR